MVIRNDFILILIEDAGERNAVASVLSREGVNYEAVATMQHALDILRWRRATLVVAHSAAVRSLRDLRQLGGGLTQQLVLAAAGADERLLAACAEADIDLLAWPVAPILLLSAIRRGIATYRLEKQKERFEQLAIYDELTGIYNRRFLLSALPKEIARALRTEQELALCMFDVDNFKFFNDSYGHQCGDRVLQEVTHHIKLALRQIDVFCRYGGEEFIMVLPDSNQAAAMVVAERLRLIINRMRVEFPPYHQLRVTISIGVAIAPHDAGDAEALIQKADMALLVAKRSGKDRVTAWSPSLFEESHG